MIVFAGPCVIESRDLVLSIAERLKKDCEGLPIDLHFKASFDKANRSSIKSFRGPGIEEGLKILSEVKSQFGLKVVTDYHTPEQAMMVAEVADCLQVPAFLCRQTDMILEGAQAALKYHRRLNVKKGQFLAPWDTKNIVDKCTEVVGKEKIRSILTLTERGTSFGYNRLIVDMAAFQEMQTYGVQVIYDATHSVQSPGAAAGGTVTGGQRENIEVLSRAAMAAGADGVFLECHPEPSKAKSDAANAFYLESVGPFLKQLLEIKNRVAGMSYLCPEARQIHS